ncbi:Pup--protein ligase [Actinomyces bovis]|uniref:Pup--protein ligase n=1 Tax=Actinomyces bovis TaxID=1658 RepID=A0ABY1VQM2_9ACTO|nr:proteasome accessory factor PafA2 family protein [Actinomyces bovis]SPT53353.1 Pup--protein ligase [Actinomyces bovis]VEG52722.1 Pup--protein ligase [Actinomyces israelii]
MTAACAGRLHRVVGIETEYGVTSAYLEAQAVPEEHGAAEAQEVVEAPLSVKEAVDELFRGVPAASGTHRFTQTGARLYVDIGLHPEYAGPECLWTSDVVAQDLAGDLLLSRMAQAANARLASRGARIHVLKSNTDAWGATFGCHENYQVERQVELPLGGLIGLLAARQILTGAGSLPLAQAAGGPAATGKAPLGPLRYSARAEHIVGAASADPTHERAFINTRDEPHADAQRWRRLHVIAGDSAISPWTTALKVVLVDAALTLVERGAWNLAECELVDPAGAAQLWNRDPLRRCERAGGLGAVNCPELLDLALDHLETLAELPDEQPDALTGQVLALARRGCQALHTGDYSPVVTELDWAIKHRVLARVAQRSQLGWQDPRVRRAELAYHDLSASTGLRQALTQAGLMAPLVSPEQVERAVQEPPSDTRASLRGRVVAACESTGRFLSVSWAHVRLDTPPHSQIDLLDPRCSQDDAVEVLLQEIAALGPVA